MDATRTKDKERNTYYPLHCPLAQYTHEKATTFKFNSCSQNERDPFPSFLFFSILLDLSKQMEAEEAGEELLDSLSFSLREEDFHENIMHFLILTIFSTNSYICKHFDHLSDPMHFLQLVFFA